MTGMVRDMKPDAARMKAAAGAGYSTATDLADWLVRTLEAAVPRGASRHRPDRGARPSEAGVPLEKLPLADHAGDRAAHHQGGVRRAVGRALGRRAGPAMAAPRPRMCGARPTKWLKRLGKK